MTQSADRRALAALLFGACVIGLSPILARITEAETGPAAAGFWRLAFAGPLLVLPLLQKPKAFAAGRAWAWGLAAGVLFALDVGTWHYGVAMTSVTNATVLSNMTPVAVALTAWLVFRERPSGGFLLALVLALGGAVGMGLAKGSGGRGTDPLLGDALSLVAAVFYGLYFVLIRIARAKASTSALMFWTSVSGAPATLLMAFLMREPIWPSGPAGWLGGLGLGVMHVVGQGAIAWALGRLPATTTSVVVLVQPVVSALLGLLLFGERITPLQALSAAVLLLGVVLAQRSAAVQARQEKIATPKNENGPGDPPEPGKSSNLKPLRATSD
jgi:drug/metabolite transporter (DMT)-like permease